MAQHSEKDYIIPTLLVLYEHSEGCTTEAVKEEVSKYITLSGDDMKPYPSRNPNEPRFHQIVGNLISHANNTFFQYVDRIVPEHELGKKSPKYIMRLNNLGQAYVKSVLDRAETGKNIIDIDGKVGFDRYDQKIVELAKKSHNKVPQIRDQKLAKEVIEISNYKCQYALITGEKHMMFSAKDGKPYAEAHHLIPIKASKDFFPRNLDRASNIVCLCPNCHSILHHGSKEEKRKILKVLYDEYIKVLNEDENIFISFEDLLNKYY